MVSHMLTLLPLLPLLLPLFCIREDLGKSAFLFFHELPEILIPFISTSLYLSRAMRGPRRCLCCVALSLRRRPARIRPDKDSLLFTSQLLPLFVTTELRLCLLPKTITNTLLTSFPKFFSDCAIAHCINGMPTTRGDSMYTQPIKNLPRGPSGILALWIGSITFVRHHAKGIYSCHVSSDLFLPRNEFQRDAFKGTIPPQGGKTGGRAAPTARPRWGPAPGGGYVPSARMPVDFGRPASATGRLPPAA
jgi:hypothetical protein